VTARSDVIAVCLFGSLAEGRAVPGSDADIMLLLRETSRRFMDRPLEYAPYFRGAGMPVEVFCYTVEEAARNSFARHALNVGTVLASHVPALPSPQDT
jgi:predicted nucleotidyltransferase